MKTVAVSVLLALAAATHAQPPAPADGAAQPPASALWNADRSAAAVHSRVDGRARVLAFVRQDDGTFATVDLSEVENRNLGKLGRNGPAYKRVETRALQWIDRKDGLLQLRVRTQAWRQGQRYTVEEPVLFDATGRVLWR